MATVTQRIKVIEQPRGGYVPVRSFKKIKLDDEKELNSEENISPILVGLAVDYMTRYLLSRDAKVAFNISLRGADIAKEKAKAKKLLLKIKGNDDKSIKCACKLVGYDVCYRADPGLFKGVDQINPDENTIQNIKIMLDRSISFWNKYGPVIKSDFTFEGGYTPVIHAGDGDYLTKDTLWDFKVTKKPPTSKHTLQLLIYYLMGTHSTHKEFLNITKLGIFNPRLNMIYLLDISKIEPYVIEIANADIIGYDREKLPLIPKYEASGLIGEK